LSAKIDVLGGNHTLLGGVDYDWTSFYSGMGLFVRDSPLGMIDLSDPTYTLTYTAQTPINSYQSDHYQTIAGYVQDQATYGHLHLTGGLRFTALHVLEGSSVRTDSSKVYYHVSPCIGATFDLVSGVAFFVGYATAFRAPFGFIGLSAAAGEFGQC
jgi:iron complex outermembrane receptor protein